MTKEELEDFVSNTKYILGVYITNLHIKSISKFSEKALLDSHRCLDICEKFLKSLEDKKRAPK